MTVLEATNITISYGHGVLLDRVSFRIEREEKLGLIGANGAGKTSLVRVLAGQLEADTGTVTLGKGQQTQIAYIPQFFPAADDANAVEYMVEDQLRLRRRLRDLEDELSSADSAKVEKALATYTAVRETYDAVDGDYAEEHAEGLLARNGLAYLSRTPLSKLSGGEINRLQILRGLLARPDLLILDEPGNHLDAWGLDWLEGALSAFPAAVLVISHNRYLLDRLVTGIVHVREGRLNARQGTYSDYRRASLIEAVKSEEDARADKKHLERLEAMVSYLAQLAHAKADTGIGKRLRARKTQLAKARADAREAVPATERAPTVRFDQDAGRVRSDIALEIRDLTLEVPAGPVSDPPTAGGLHVGTSAAAAGPLGNPTDGGRALLRGAEAFVGVGEKVALIGPNGCGKTTLIRRIVEKASWDDPHVRLGPSMQIAYCAQDRSIFDPEKSILEAFREIGGISRDRVFHIVSPYMFSYQDLEKRIGDLSGGETNRLQLARAQLVGANFLVLDEPTNHLDIPSREAVERALVEFEGTVLVVSHDRYLLDTVVDKVIAFEDRSLVTYEGTFSDYWVATGHSIRFAVGRSALERLEQELEEAMERGDLASAKKIKRRMEKARRMSS